MYTALTLSQHRFRFEPIAMFADEVYQLVHRFGGRYVSTHNFLSLVKRDTARSGSHITVVRIGHFAWPVYDASHNADLDAFQMARSRSDLRSSFLQIEQGSAAGRTRNVLRFGNACACSLQDIEGSFIYLLVGRRASCPDEHAIAKAIYQETTDIRGRIKLQLFG